LLEGQNKLIFNFHLTWVHFPHLECEFLHANKPHTPLSSPATHTKALSLHARVTPLKVCKGEQCWESVYLIKAALFRLEIGFYLVDTCSRWRAGPLGQLSGLKLICNLVARTSAQRIVPQVVSGENVTGGWLVINGIMVIWHLWPHWKSFMRPRLTKNY